MATSGLSTLDEAYGRYQAGEHEAALRGAIALLERSSSDLGAVALAAEVLVANERGDIAGEALVRLVDAFARRGDFAASAAAILVAGRAGEDVAPLRTGIAKAFARGSKRLSDETTPSPPPLPSDARPKGALAKLSGDALLDRGENVLREYLGTDDPVAEDAALPRLPLASALGPESLARLLEAMTIVDLATGGVVIKQGTEGKAAYIVVRGMAEALRGEGDDEVRLAALGPGALFGEMALVSDAPRAASVRALEPTRLLEVKRDALEKLAQKDPIIAKELGEYCRMRMVSNLFRHSAILAAVEPAERNDLMARFDTRAFEPGDALVREGEEGGGLFLIASGAVEVRKSDADGDRIRLAELGPGDVVGEISLVLRRPATADVVARHATIALELTRDKFQQAIKDHPTLLNELYQLATAREEETQSVVAQEALDVEDLVIL